MNPVNSTHIAHLLNVSQASVSRAFDGGSSMTQRKRTQILKRCIAEGYRVSDAQTLLRTENPIRIAFLINELHNPFFSSLINDFAETVAQQNQYSLEFHVVTDQSESHLRTLLKNLKRTGVQSLISASHMSDSALPQIADEYDFPLIAINRSVIHSATSSVAADNYKNAYKVAEYLYDKGHANILFIADNKNVPTIAERLHGVLDFADATSGVAVSVLRVDLSYDGAYQGVKANPNMIQGQGITAIIGGNDIMAIGAIDALRGDYNINVPADMNVFGFDDIPMAGWQAYQLSTVRQRTRLMSQEALEVLNMVLEHNESGLERKSQGAFILRNTA